MRKNNVLKVMLCIVMLCVVSAFAASASAASSSESEQFLQLINMERANAGVSAVTIGSQNLNDAAQARAQELTSRYSYVRPNGQREFTILSEYGVADASVGEAYWAGTETPEETVAAWMSNDYFRACLLDGNVKNFGVGHYHGGEYGDYWVVICTYPVNADEFSQQVMTLVNKERTSRGLNALVLGGANLNAATELRARELAEVNSHTRPDGTSCFTVLNTFNVKDQAVGEVAAWGSRSPEEVVNSWMNSDGHRAILLDPEARKMCVSCYYDTNSDYGTNWAMLVTE